MSITNWFLSNSFQESPNETGSEHQARLNEMILKENEDTRLMRAKEEEHAAHEADSAEWAAREISDTLVYDYGVSEDAGNALYDVLVDALQNRSSREHEAIVRSVKGY